MAVSFDRVDGPMRVDLDVAINPQTALPVTCIGDPDGLAEACTCRREDGSIFECTHTDRKESACCVTADPETVPLRATVTATPCTAH